MKKILALILTISMVSVGFVGCGKPVETEGPAKVESGEVAESEDAAPETDRIFEGETITWLSYGPGENNWEGPVNRIVKVFEEETGATVKTEFYAFNDLFEVIEVKLGSGSSDYDVVSVDVPMVAGYVQRGYLTPMNDYFTEEELTGFIDSSVAAGTWDGDFYAPPMNTSAQLLWTNEALLEEAGITIPENSVDNRLTWEQVTQMAEETLAVVDPDRNQGFAGLMFQQVSRTYQMNAIPNSMGEKSMGDDGLTVDGIINTEGWEKACNWYQQLYEDGIALRGITSDEMSDVFHAGKIVFMAGGTWTKARADEAGFTDYGYYPMPTFEGYEDEIATSTGSWHFGIPTNTENKDVAGEFIKWMTLGEGNTLWLEEHSDVPASIAGVKELIEDDNASELMKIAAYEAENTAVPRAVTPGYTEYDTVIANMWEDIRNGTDVKAALDSATAQINTALEKYK